MTEVARVGAPRIERRFDRWVADLMAADRLQQAIGGVRHVTVHADAAARLSTMVRVLGDEAGVAIRLVTLPARAVLARRRERLQLIVCPFRDRPPIVRGLMHRVTRRAGQRAAIVRRALVARRPDRRGGLAAGGGERGSGPDRLPR